MLKFSIFMGLLKRRSFLGINFDESDKAPTADTRFISFKKYIHRVMTYTDIAYIQWIKKELTEDYEIDLLVMGHSLDATDQDIIKDLFEAAHTITFLCYNEEAMASYIANLVKIFGLDQFCEMRYAKNLLFVPQISSEALISNESEVESLLK